MHDVLYAHRPSFLTLRLFDTARLFIAIFVSPFSSDLCMIVLADIAVIVVGY